MGMVMFDPPSKFVAVPFAPPEMPMVLTYFSLLAVAAVPVRSPGSLPEASRTAMQFFAALWDAEKPSTVSTSCASLPTLPHAEPFHSWMVRVLLEFLTIRFAPFGRLDVPSMFHVASFWSRVLSPGMSLAILLTSAGMFQDMAMFYSCPAKPTMPIADQSTSADTLLPFLSSTNILNPSGLWTSTNTVKAE